MNKLLEIALTQYAVKEVAGSKHNPVILGYLSDLNILYINDDETPWCSTFLNWCALKGGMERTDQLTARSWLKVGIEIDSDKGQLGDVVVFKRGTQAWQGHVAIYIKETPKYIYALGGNQKNEVNISKYEKNSLLGVRRLRYV